MDLLTVLPDTTPNQLHPYFADLVERPARAPARAVLREIGPWLTALDPHFVREFQRHQFDPRLWELYLWAALREGGYEVEHRTAPDFRASAPWGAFALEATVAAPSIAGALADHPNPETPQEISEFNKTYMPMKYAAALTKKLNRRSSTGKAYWEEDGVEGLPFVIGIADFHRPATEKCPGSMTYTQSAISAYLYGIESDWEMIDGELVIRNRTITTHQFGDKTIESGFFNLPGAENISAVVFSNAGTIAKFDRIGILAGYRPQGARYFRVGLRFNPDPNAAFGIPFFEEVGAEDYEEGWADELQVFHNPRALRPLPMECFVPLAQHVFKDGRVVTHYGHAAVLSSYTLIMQPHDEQSGRPPAA